MAATVAMALAPLGASGITLSVTTPRFRTGSLRDAMIAANGGAARARR